MAGGAGAASRIMIRLPKSSPLSFLAKARVSGQLARDPLTDVKVVFNLVPMVVNAVMITTAMSAAISPYSMAVAADSS
jgi:hypothetical protein